MNPFDTLVDVGAFFAGVATGAFTAYKTGFARGVRKGAEEMFVLIGDTEARLSREYEKGRERLLNGKSVGYGLHKNRDD